jgi:hypothetical protein
MKAKLLPKDSVLELNTTKLDVPELNTTKLANSPSFLTHTHTTLYAKYFKSYRILTIGVATNFSVWTEQQQNRS